MVKKNNSNKIYYTNYLKMNYNKKYFDNLLEINGENWFIYDITWEKYWNGSDDIDIIFYDIFFGFSLILLNFYFRACQSQNFVM